MQGVSRRVAEFRSGEHDLTLVRSKSGTPTWRSKARMAWLTLAVVTCSR